ncbi:hypothetical protein HNQ94_000574 [Salirhabdus euzebyi]|uniref:Lipoprotein n=1 Tax=Salirhabdus euzebyi TaxID=394506 RepID=A0A841Q1K5_9BACI|nr:hypothetical protein [Salirhabdus euzebyi]MBB6452153.1 hypothetical protein [Salirhabdus euzebyi]
MQIKGVKKFLLLLFSLSLIFLLSGCFLSEEKALENAKEEAEKSFMADPLETNQKIDDISIYLPEGMEINGSSNNNVFLAKEDQDYLLFYNQFESEDSQHLFEGIKARPESLLLHSYEDDKRFGYIAVFPHQEEEYELQVGIGGVKITTITTLDNLEEESSDLMEIVNSSILNNEK